MTGENTGDWNAANQRYLMAAVKLVQEELESYRNVEDRHEKNGLPQPGAATPAQQELKDAALHLPAPAALDNLTGIFGLSTFERKLLLMCAGVELDTHFSEVIAALQGSPSFVHPTISLALAVFPDAHWSAISPDAPLRYWRLTEVQNGELLTKSALKIDEHILHYLTGVHYVDERLRELLSPVPAGNFLVPSQQALAASIISACAPATGRSTLPVIQLTGSNRHDKMGIAAAACAGMGYRLHALSASLVPGSSKETSELIRLWNREAALHSCALLLDCSTLDLNDKGRVEAVTGFIENVMGMLIIAGNDWAPRLKRRKIELTVLKPGWDEQLLLWKKGLGDGNGTPGDQLEKLVSHFNLSAKTIDLASREVVTQIQQETQTTDRMNASAPLTKLLWKACCLHTRLSIDELAQRIEPVASWNDIVLPEVQKQTLREIATQVKHRNKVYKEWGFAGMGARGLGISALFTGESGTGKTMASEVLANELQLDLYRIDLSQVVNKYIGETEKNLKRIFDAAEEGGAILLFDEADALFGKRSEVKDSHDRYSNIEVSYLLQRMEAYGGLAVLTTNMKNAIDKAFLRRIRFVVQFPYPDALHRAEIWRRIFPAGTPVKNLDIAKLSSLSVPGGNIRNIAINAAFMAADEDQPVQMHHLSRAARSEYTKLDKAMNNFDNGLS